MFNPQYYFRLQDFIGLLDIYPGASQAYSFRRLSKNYTGYCINVLRTSDNATLDIGFVNNYLDTTSLLAFAGASTVIILKFYDQSGNNRDITGGGGVNIFRIVNAGVLNLTSGMVYGEIMSQNIFTTSFTPYSLNAHSLFYTHNVKSISSYGGIFLNRPASGNGTMYASENASSWRNNRVAYLNTAQRASNTMSIRTTSKSTPTGVYLTNWNYDGNTTSSLKENDILQTLGGSSSGWGNSVLGSLGGFNGSHALQDIFEIIVYPSDKTSDSSVINTLIKTYYGL
jgi:hypothetical protein